MLFKANKTNPSGSIKPSRDLNPEKFASKLSENMVNLRFLNFAGSRLDPL